MKLIIHCGLHKTGTTSFQMLCAENRSLLRSVGIHYPIHGKSNQHSYILHDAQRSGLHLLGAYLAESCAEAKTDCHTVLLSGEDFENCIIDVALASDIETLVHESGFDLLEWVVVTRPKNDTVASLYAEMSKHGVVLSRDIMQKAGEERGCFYVSTKNYNYIFVLDFARFAARFRQHVSGQVVEYEYESFVRDYPGMMLLKQLLPEDAFIRFCQSAKISNHRANKRLRVDLVEANYTATALGLERLRRKRIFRPMLVPFIWLRLLKARRIARNGG